jgi:hydroxymethylpyrimidine/phosphomethylpyrimidine kinase
MPQQDLLPPDRHGFAASDPTGGAGLQADIMTLASMGCHPLSVRHRHDGAGFRRRRGRAPIDADWVADQARALLEDMPVAAFKIGMLGSVENIAAIAEIISDYPDIPLVLDPVLASGRGDELAERGHDRADDRELLLPQTTMLTPNSMEARRLALDDEDEPRRDPDLAECARAADRRRLRVRADHRHPRRTRPRWSTPCMARTRPGPRRPWERLPGSYHGSGCTLASAIAANLANGLDIADAVRDAQEYTWQSLAHGFRPGMGQHFPDRFFWAREAGDAEEG